MENGSSVLVYNSQGMFRVLDLLSICLTLLQLTLDRILVRISSTKVSTIDALSVTIVAHKLRTAGYRLILNDFAFILVYLTGRILRAPQAITEGRGARC